MRRRVFAIALAVLAAILLVVLRWHSLVPAPTPELPSSQAKAARKASPVSAQLAYREGDSDDAPDWQVAGTVVDERGVAVANASLEVDLVCWHGDEQQPPSRTDAAGRFAFELLPDCVMWLYAASGDESARVVVPKAPGDAITVQLARDNAVILHVVDDKTHAPIRGARVKDWPCPREPCPELLGDDRGIVRLPRSHTVEVRADGYAPRMLELELTWGLYDGPLPPRERTIALIAALTIRGRALGVDGAPVVRASVSVERAYSEWTQGPPPPTTDDDGRFEVVAHEGSRVDIGGPCVDGYYSSASAVAVPNQLLELRLVKHGTCSTPPPRPALRPPPEFDATVTVIDDRGRPVANAEIRSFVNGFRPGRTDATGRYVFRTPGAGGLYARRGERMSALMDVDGEHRDVTMRIQPAAITGIVVDDDGHPIARAWVRVRLPRTIYSPGSDIRDQLSDQQGHFGVVLPPGRYLVSAFDEFLEDAKDGDNATVIATDTHDVTFEVR